MSGFAIFLYCGVNALEMKTTGILMQELHTFIGQCARASVFLLILNNYKLTCALHIDIEQCVQMKSCNQCKI